METHHSTYLRRTTIPLIETNSCSNRQNELRKNIIKSPKITKKK